jgi:hypothetical protein
MRFGNTVLVAFVQLLSSSVDSIHGLETTHAKRALYAQETTEQLETNNFIPTYKLDTDKRSLRGGASSGSDDESVESVNDVESDSIELDQATRGPEQIGKHFTINISSDDDASQIQPDVSVVGKTGTRWVYHLCHPAGASFINVHFSDFGKLRFCQLHKTTNGDKTPHAFF